MFPKTQQITSSLLKEKKIKLYLKRIDENCPYVSGNKIYKLKYNIDYILNKGYKKVLTFGGAYSNHILATAYIANKFNLSSTGIIRGDEVLPLNPTLKLAKKYGMNLIYFNRKNYKLLTQYQKLTLIPSEYKESYILPEGGTNKLAVRGTQEILDLLDNQDYICCSVGTGGTISGLINSSNQEQNILGFPAIKGISLLEENIIKWSDKANWKLINDYHFGGYSKFDNNLIDFIMEFYAKYSISLDMVYTGKMMYGIFDLINKDFFPKNSTILAIHTGGLQGNLGMNIKFGLDLPHNL